MQMPKVQLIDGWWLGEAEIFAAGGHGGIELVAESFVGDIFGKVKFYKEMSTLAYM